MVSYVSYDILISMTDTSMTRSTACNLIILASLPTEEFLAVAHALEDRPVPYADSNRRAATIQLDLTVISILRSYVETDDPRESLISPGARPKLLGLPLERLVGPPGSALSHLRTEYLADPTADLSREWAAAKALQSANSLPADVPPLGHIMTKSQTSIGQREAALVQPPAMKALLLAQACLRAMLSPADRRAHLYMRSAPSDPQPLRAAQEIGNRILVSGAPHTEEQRTAVETLTLAAEGLLTSTGFSKLAEQVGEFRQIFTGKPERTARERRHGPTVSQLLSQGSFEGARHDQ